jgi:hypothetical protein
MNFREDEDDEDVLVDQYLCAGELREFLKDVPDHFKIYIEKVDDVIYNNMPIEKIEIKDKKSPDDMIYKFVRGLQLVAYGLGDERDGIYITAYPND